ncbi:MAG: sigma-70 family RNA polymerase sigma factor, partial [Verrucomicrobia bacterium]|nr:sigma-70 family RNA polymerase sigma factor [Verrucomicrobiota bacterium]
ISRWLLEYQNVSPPSERFDRLCSAKAALNESERVLLSMRYDDGLGINEIADLLAVPEGTVKSRLHNIILKLRKLMEKKHEHQ